jgi:hypothetical protein
MGYYASQNEALLPAALDHFLELSKHSILVKTAIADIRIGPAAQLELGALFCCVDLDAGRRQPLLVFLTQPGIDDMKGLVAALEPVFDEREYHPILLVGRVKESADMTLCAKG